MKFRTNALMIVIVITLVFLGSLYLFAEATGQGFCGLVLGLFALLWATVLMLFGGA